MRTRRLRDLSPRKMPRQARSGATVNAIFEATIQVLLADGIRRLTTTRVAERAGVSVGTMYQYFPHKEALIRAIIERYLGQVAEAVEKCCANNIGQRLTVASDALVLTYIEAKSQDADVSRALYSASSELEVTDLVSAAFQRFNIAAARLFRSCPDARFGQCRLRRVHGDGVADRGDARRIREWRSARHARRLSRTNAVDVSCVSGGRCDQPLIQRSWYLG
jgi:AcrR family transcriptional regulator